MRIVTATRYVTPLREGGSLPALIEADDDGLYVCKFRGAGQGPKALVAEIVAGELARALELPGPEIVLVELDPALGHAEPDPEIQDLLAASAGTNLGLDFLPGSLPFDAGSADALDSEMAAAVVWFDALVTNVDRTPRNPNLLVWHDRLWLIDHGAALYAQHGLKPLAEQATHAFNAISEHVLLPFAGSIAEVDARLARRLTHEVIATVTAQIPAEWVTEPPSAYADYLAARLEAPRSFVEEAEHARTGA